MAEPRRGTKNATSERVRAKRRLGDRNDQAKAQAEQGTGQGEETMGVKMELKREPLSLQIYTGPLRPLRTRQFRNHRRDAGLLKPPHDRSK